MSEDPKLKTEKEETAKGIEACWNELRERLLELWWFVGRNNATPDRIKEVQTKLEKCTDLGIYLEDPEINEEELNQKWKEQS